MTESEAIAVVEENNLVLDKAGIQYGVVPQWDGSFQKDYEVVLFPSIYASQFSAGTDSQKIGFRRVSVLTISKGLRNIPDWVDEFNNQILIDPELNEYLLGNPLLD